MHVNAELSPLYLDHIKHFIYIVLNCKGSGCRHQKPDLLLSSCVTDLGRHSQFLQIW